jgi:ABC-type transport system substrate-binding protein
MWTGRRAFLTLRGVATTSALLGACVPSTPPPPPSASQTQEAQPYVAKLPRAKLKGPTIVTDAADYPKTLKEAPGPADLVKAGKLPPVQDRIGRDQRVVQPLRAIAKYGGTMRRAFNGSRDTQDVARFSSGPDSMLAHDYQWNLYANIARNYELSSDSKTLTVHLRRGSS